MNRFSKSSLALVVACLVFAGHAAAQPSPNAQADAQTAMERGVAASKKGDFARALVEYQHATELVPEANLPHRFSADALVELHRYEEAITEYETYLRIKPNVQDATTVRQKIDDLRARYVEGVLDVECTPDGAEVVVDDQTVPAGNTPLRGLRLHAGPHTITVRAEGYRDGSWPSQVAAGSTRVVQCTLQRVGATYDSPPAAPPTAPDRESPHAKSSSIFGTWWFWTGVGVVVAGATVTAIAVSSKGESTPRTDGGTLKFP